ncbi:uncharacterized protein LOC135205655 isoform X2 [Macrobrachium nipponense]|uniref:uncharacterized protein LOC135205655 isoform X2 n=1 Tax=Macrobrachium nipponense TaxID=159736 RepID=UPI0030C7F75F
MRMEGNDDILSMAQRRQAGRRTGRPPFPGDHVLRIDNFTSGPTTPIQVPPSPMRYEPKGFLAEVAGERRREAKVSVPMFLEEVAYSRNSLPPLVAVEVRPNTSAYPVQGTEVAALIHTASHISLMSSNLVQELGVRQDVIPDNSMPPSPLSGSGSSWLVEGKLRYVELSFNGSKHVTQLYIARDLPADLVLGVDFLKKAQIRVNFPENNITLNNGTQETKVFFLSNKEMNQHNQRRASNNATNIVNKTRAYSSNY